MAKVIKASEQSLIMEISKTEMNIYVNSCLTQINNEEIEDDKDQIIHLMALTGLEPLVSFCIPEIRKFYADVVEDVKNIEWEDNNENENQEESGVEGIPAVEGEEYSDGEEPDHPEM